MSTSSVPTPWILGLTGGIGSGKSAAAQHFIDLGIDAVDADHAARWVVEPGRPALARIAEQMRREPIGRVNGRIISFSAGLSRWSGGPVEEALAAARKCVTLHAGYQKDAHHGMFHRAASGPPFTISDEPNCSSAPWRGGSLAASAIPGMGG